MATEAQILKTMIGLLRGQAWHSLNYCVGWVHIRRLHMSQTSTCCYPFWGLSP